jgi:uncharacterized membrane protein HdeD (DUF308 family)
MATTVMVLGVEDLRHKWGWFLALGIALMVLGVIALGMIPVATLAAVMVLGWLLVFSGIVEAVHGFQVHRWGGMFLHLAGGVLGVLIGLLIVTHPVAGALAWTLLFASFFTVVGLFRLVAAIRLSFRTGDGRRSMEVSRRCSAYCLWQGGPGRACGSWASRLDFR